MDKDPKALKRLGSTFRVQALYSDVEELLAEQDIDILDIVTPGFTHYPLAELAIGKGVNVLVEKPLTLSVKDAELLRVHSEREGVSVCVIQNYRFRKPLLKLMNLLARGEIGSIGAVNFTVRGGSLFNNPAWFWDENKSGGILYELAIHEADLQTLLMGRHEKVLSVWKDFDRGLRILKGIVALVRYSENRVATLDLRWFSSSPLFRMDVLATVTDVTIKFNPDSIAILEGERTPYYEFKGELKRMIDYGIQVSKGKVRVSYSEPHRAIFEAFAKSVESKTSPPVGIEGVLPGLSLLEDLKNSSSTVSS